MRHWRSDEEARVMHAVCEWLDLKNRWEKPTGVTAADAWHSALLHRLLAGKKPFPEPPPLANGSPWYDLIEQGYADHCSVWVSTDIMHEPTRQSLCINGGSGWMIVDSSKTDQYIVQYKNKGPRWLVYKDMTMDDWYLQHNLCWVMKRMYDDG